MKDETLILYYYNDGLSAGERRKIAAALNADTELATRYEALCRDLDALGDPGDVPLPEGLEYRLKSALQRAVRLEEAGKPGNASTPHTRPFFRPALAFGGGLVAALALGISIGVWMVGHRPPGPQVVSLPPTTSPEWSPVAFQHGLASHFRSGRAEIAELSAQTAPDRAALVTALMRQNRLYARLAQQNDAPDLARVLRSFEPILVQLAREDLSAQEAASLQAQLEFEFSVMLTKLGRDSSQQTESHTQEMSL